MQDAPRLRICLTSYRSKPHSGGQGIYLRHLSRELAALGHDVEIISGPPYPELDEGPRLTKLTSLDLYRDPDPFRIPNWREFHTSIDALEFAGMCTGAFLEPMTFSFRAARVLAERDEKPDIVHDNQTLGYGFLQIAKTGVPVVASIHHPITVDRRLELADAKGIKRKFGIRRFYSFLRMQGRVARRMQAVVTVSESSRRDIVRDFRVDPSRIELVPLGVDDTVFRPQPDRRVPGRIVTTASADVPLKGLAPLLEAVAKLRTEHDVQLVVIGSLRDGSSTKDTIDRLDLQDHVEFRSGLSEQELVETFNSAHVAVVPSLYEGFSLPAVEVMSCAVPLVATTAGALPEVTGPSGEAALHVEPGDPQQLALAIAAVLTDDDLAQRLGASARKRVEQYYSWKVVAKRTVEWYRRCIEDAQKAQHADS